MNAGAIIGDCPMSEAKKYSPISDPKDLTFSRGSTRMTRIFSYFKSDLLVGKRILESANGGRENNDLLFFFPRFMRIPLAKISKMKYLLD